MTTAKPTLTYFDAPVSRGEECRLALHAAGIEFHDDRVPFADWAARKPTMAYGAMPVLQWPGQPEIAHSNAILTLIGRRHGLHPTDDFEAARHEGMMIFCEELRGHVSPTLRMPDAEKKAAREALAQTYLPQWGAIAERHIAADGPFFAGAKLQVVDLKLYMIVKWFNGGRVDHIPADIFAPFPRLTRVHDAVAAHPTTVAWYARR